MEYTKEKLDQLEKANQEARQKANIIRRSLREAEKEENRTAEEFSNFMRSWRKELNKQKTGA